MILPGKLELLELFEVEPVILDSDVPPSYNTLTFTSVRGQDVVRCQILPGEGDITFDWTHAGRPKLHLRVGAAETLRVELGRDAEALVAAFSDRSGLVDLRIQLKPTIRVAWGSADTLGPVSFSLDIPG